MKKSIYTKSPRIIKLKKRLEKELEVKIEVRGREITIDGPAEKEYIAEQVLDSIEMGFELNISLLLKNEDFRFEMINVKEYAKSNNLESVRARIIGKNRKSLDTIEQLTNSSIQLKDNQLGIIGPVETIGFAREALILLMKGTKHGNVYAYLEKHRFIPIVDLGLKK